MVFFWYFNISSSFSVFINVDFVMWSGNEVYGGESGWGRSSTGFSLLRGS